MTEYPLSKEKFDDWCEAHGGERGWVQTTQSCKFEHDEGSFHQVSMTGGESYPDSDFHSGRDPRVVMHSADTQRSREWEADSRIIDPDEVRIDDGKFRVKDGDSQIMFSPPNRS